MTPVTAIGADEPDDQTRRDELERAAFGLAVTYASCEDARREGEAKRQSLVQELSNRMVLAKRKARVNREKHAKRILELQAEINRLMKDIR